MFSSDDNNAQKLILGDGVTVKYKREDLSQVNPQLYKWLAIINDKSSVNNIVSQDNDIVNDSVRSDDENDTTKKRTDNWLMSNRLQLPLDITKYGSIKIITYPK